MLWFFLSHSVIHFIINIRIERNVNDKAKEKNVGGVKRLNSLAIMKVANGMPFDWTYPLHKCNYQPQYKTYWNHNCMHIMNKFVTRLQELKHIYDERERNTYVGQIKPIRMPSYTFDRRTGEHSVGESYSENSSFSVCDKCWFLEACSSEMRWVMLFVMWCHLLCDSNPSKILHISLSYRSIRFVKVGGSCMFVMRYLVSIYEHFFIQ